MALNPFHTHWMHQTLQKVPAYSSFLWEDHGSGGEMPDRLQALLIREGRGIKGHLSSRAIVHGGPLMAIPTRDSGEAAPGNGPRMAGQGPASHSQNNTEQQQGSGRRINPGHHPGSAQRHRDASGQDQDGGWQGQNTEMPGQDTDRHHHDTGRQDHSAERQRKDAWRKGQDRQSHHRDASGPYQDGGWQGQNTEMPGQDEACRGGRSQQHNAGRQQRFEGLIRTMIETLHRQCVYIQLRNFFDFESDQHAFLLRQGFRFQDEMNFVVPLEPGRDPITGFSASRRRQVRRGLESGARIEAARDDQDVLAFYDILARTYRLRAKKPLAPPELFLHFARGPFLDGKGCLLLVKHGGRVIGGIMLLHDEDKGIHPAHPAGGDKSAGQPVYQGQDIYGRRVYEWYVCGMDQEYPRLHPSVLATWGGIHHAWQNGFDAFDFMGAGNPSIPYGVRDFKARFGGIATRHGRYLRINKPLVYQLGKAAVGLYSRFR